MTQEQELRFAFGDNWRKFLSVLDEPRILEAENSLKERLGAVDLKGRTFLDAGCGSGLFSLAARRLGAAVRSFDYDPSSVGCAWELRRRFDSESDTWIVEQGSLVDAGYMDSLGEYDIVYCWGVLHHTGEMWRALDLLTRRVKPAGGVLFIAIYNDQGRKSRWWRVIKRTYCRLPRALQAPAAAGACVWIWGPRMLLDALRLKPFETWRHYKERRGMSPWRDVVDWVGGYPFEVAKPEEVFEFCKNKGLTLEKLVTWGGGPGCNEFVWVSSGKPPGC